MRRWLTLLLLLFTAACAAEVDRETAVVDLSVPPDCGITELGEVQLTVTGDFVSETRTLGAASDSERFGGLPADGQHIIVRGEPGGEPVGDVISLVSGTAARPALMLPLDRGCALPEDGPSMLPGAAVVALPDGGLLAFGGHRDGVATDRVLVRRPGEARLRTLPARMALPRTQSSATLVGEDLVVVAGGGAETSRLIYDSFEVFDLATETFLRRRGGKLAGGPRSDHSAVALPDGRVLLVGGIGASSDAPVNTAELIAADLSGSMLIDGGVDDARRAPALIRLRSGIAIVIGGYDARGVAVSSAEWFDPQRDRFMPTGAQLAVFPRAAAVALPGDRIAWFGCDPRAGPCGLQILLPSFEVATEPIGRTELGTAALDMPGLEFAGGARLRVRGTDAEGRPRSYTVDFGSDTVSGAVLSAQDRGQWLLTDGVRLRQDADGLRWVRERLSSPYDDPPAGLLDPDDLRVVLDAPGRWNVSEAGLSARAAQARFDVPALRFDTLRASIEVEGTAELLLSPDGRLPVPVSIDLERVSIGTCGLPRAEGFPVEVLRRGRSVQLHSAERRRTCDVPALAGAVAVGVRAAPGARVENLSLRRR